VNLDNDLHDSDPQEREISLGTATIIGIFLALALVCAAFFGFGYSLGRHSNQPVVTAAAPETKTDSPFSKFKAQPDDDAQPDTPSPSTTPAEKAPKEKASDRVVVPQDTPKPSAPTRTPVAFPVPAQPTATAATQPPVAGATQSIVQVSATSRRGDAEALIAALRQKGYTAAIRQVPQDNLFHVQIGPFASKKEADAMRQRLDTNGYKAIVK
jgi:DedD protein